MTLPLSTSSSDSEDQWSSHNLRSKKKTRKSSYFDRQRESNDTKEPLLPTFLKQSEYNPFTSSSEEEEFDINEKLFRNKPKPKTEKHKCRLVIALVLCGLIFLSVLVTVITIEILSKRQPVEDDSNNQTNTEANTTESQVENIQSTLKFNIPSSDIEDKTNTAELQLEGDTTTNPVNDDEANTTELQAEESTTDLKINTSSSTVGYEENEENYDENYSPIETLNSYDIQSSLEDYDANEYFYPSSFVSSYS